VEDSTFYYRVPLLLLSIPLREEVTMNETRERSGQSQMTAAGDDRSFSKDEEGRKDFI
jgi:hypothetical protein